MPNGSRSSLPTSKNANGDRITRDEPGAPWRKSSGKSVTKAWFTKPLTLTRAEDWPCRSGLAEHACRRTKSSKIEVKFETNNSVNDFVQSWQRDTCVSPRVNLVLGRVSSPWRVQQTCVKLSGSQCFFGVYLGSIRGRFRSIWAISGPNLSETHAQESALPKNQPCTRIRFTQESDSHKNQRRV